MHLCTSHSRQKLKVQREQGGEGLLTETETRRTVATSMVSVSFIRAPHPLPLSSIQFLSQSPSRLCVTWACSHSEFLFDSTSNYHESDCNVLVVRCGPNCRVIRDWCQDCCRYFVLSYPVCFKTLILHSAIEVPSNTSPLYFTGATYEPYPGTHSYPAYIMKLDPVSFLGIVFC